MSCGQVPVNVQVVVHTRQRGVCGRRFRIVLDRVGLCPQHAIFIDWNHHPSRDVRSLRGLLVGSRHGLCSRSPPHGSGYDAGKKRSQSKSSELREHGENRLFHGSSLTPTNLGMHVCLWGMFQGVAAMQCKNGRAPGNCRPKLGNRYRAGRCGRRVRRRFCCTIASRRAAAPAAAWRRFAAAAGRYREPEVHLPFSTEKSQDLRTHSERAHLRGGIACTSVSICTHSCHGLRFCSASSMTLTGICSSNCCDDSAQSALDE